MKRAITILIGLVLGACAVFNPTADLKPGVSIQGDVSAVLGTPSRIYQDPGGGETWEYSTQPYGTTCYMASFDAAGTLTRLVDALSEQERARVQPGMTREQVARMLGQHRTVAVFRLSGEEVWDWNVPHWGSGIATRFNVHFKEGRVVRTTTSTVYPMRPLGWWMFSHQ